jgi:23S rRNA (guanosine2251-2'-O)-methyltransferase
MSKVRRNKSSRYAAGHQRSWLWGKHPVLEVLEAGRWPVVEMYASETLPEGLLARVTALTKRQGGEVFVASSERLRELGHIDDHQGLLARMGPFPYASIEEVFRGGEESERDDGTPGLWLMLDAIQDTFNFGAIIRSAEALGARGLIVGVKNQAGVNSLVARTSAGAVNRIPIAEIDDLSTVIGWFHEYGAMAVVADEETGVLCNEYDFNSHTLLVLGNEGRGVCPEIVELCDTHVRIPMAGGMESLNVAASAAVLLYEAARQKS